MGRTTQQSFTLVEMIAVIVIMAIVLSIAIPAVMNLNKAQAVSTAAREVSNTLNLARQCAITHRALTRVVFPYNVTATSAMTGSSGTNLAPCYLSYAVMTNDMVGAGGWIYITKWEQLPTGAVFLYGSATSGSLDNLGGGGLSHAQMPFPTNSGTLTPVAPLAYIEFDTTGAATGIGTSTLMLTGGFVPSGGLSNGLPLVTNPSNVVTFAVDNVVGHIQVTHP